MRKFGLIAIVLLDACAPNGIRPLRPFEIATAPYHSGNIQSLVGSLMYESGCLLFRNEDGSTQLLPVWPSGSKFEESLVTFHRPAKSDQRVVIGEEILIDGQPGDWSALDNRAFERFRHQCRAEPFFVSGVTPAN